MHYVREYTLWSCVLCDAVMHVAVADGTALHVRLPLDESLFRCFVYLSPHFGAVGAMQRVSRREENS